MSTNSIETVCDKLKISNSNLEPISNSSSSCSQNDLAINNEISSLKNSIKVIANNQQQQQQSQPNELMNNLNSKSSISNSNILTKSIVSASNRSQHTFKNVKNTNSNSALSMGYQKNPHQSSSTREITSASFVSNSRMATNAHIIVKPNAAVEVYDQLKESDIVKPTSTNQLQQQNLNYQQNFYKKTPSQQISSQPKDLEIYDR